MARIKYKASFFARVLVTLFSLIPVSYSQNPYQSKKCGEIFSEDGFSGAKLELVDQDHFLNLPDNYQVTNGWNITSSIRVESGCVMNLCNDTYFDGECQTLTKGSYGKSELSSSIGFNIASAGCACERECKCADIFMRKASCARAYLSKGCNICNSYYTDLANTSDLFPDDFQGKVKSLAVRKGCELTLYPKEDYSGESEVISGEIVENYSNQFLSYECKCNNRDFVPRPPPPRPSHFPPLVDIPPTIKEILNMLGDPKYAKHEGLKASVKSWRKKRSQKNAYILLLGTTGSGKSSTINILFDNPTITKTGDYVSTTTDIHEYKVTIPIDELGLANTELRVIDTPGLGDTRGVQQDAKFLATLDDFLSTHEELKDRKPNAVLVFHQFIDNRFAGEGSRYVKMIRGFDAFRERLTDENYSNVIHVFTHFSGATKQTKRKPWARLATFKEVIEDYTTLPRPTIITVAENKGRENHLKMVNGYYQLENKEFYPRNLFEQLETITKNGGDPIGLGVFRTAFRNSDDFKVRNSTYKLVNNEGEKVQRYLRIVSNTYLGIVRTEVSQILEQVWDTDLPANLKKKYPDSLQYLQKSLHMRHINTKEDIPKTTTEILRLLTALKHDEATAVLLEKGFGISPPIFPQNSIAGFCYNIFNDAQLSVTPYEMGDLHQSDIGFMIPSFLTSKLEQSSTQNFIFVEDQQSYIQERLRSIGIEGEISPTLFKGTPKPGYNIKTIAFQDGRSVLSAQRAFKRFQFIVNERPSLKKEFIDAVKSLPTFSENDHEAVTNWTDFFNMYGTHVVKSIHGGGAIEIQLRNNGPIDKEMSKALFSLINFTENMGFFEGDNDNNTSKDGKRTVLQEGIDHTLVFSGGNPQYQTKDFTKLSIEDAVDLMSKWQKSLKYSPTLLTSEMELIPISRVAKKIGSKYELEIERVATILYNATLKYVPKTSPGTTKNGSPPPPREGTEFMTQILMEIQKSNQHLQQTMLSLQKTEMENAQRRDKLEQDRLQWEKEKALAEAAWKVEERKVINEDNDRREAQAERIRLERSKQNEINAAKQQEWMGALMNQQKAEAARSHDLMKAIISQPQRRGGSCLKAGTKIQMADGTEKPVELLEAGDVVVDKDLKPTSVLGVAHELLLGQTFYGFDNNSFFFTNSHLFVGPKDLNSGSENFTLFTKSTEYLYYNNPLLRHLNVRAMPNNGSFELFHVETLSNTKIVSEKIVTVTEDPETYPLDTPIYFIQVNSSTGTYVANGYVCRHETPDFALWPNTMSILLRLIETSAFENVSLFPYNIETEIYLQNSINNIVKRVEQFFEEREWSNSVDESNYEVMTLGDVDLDECILRIYNNPTLSSAGIGFYASVGPVIAMHLDEDTEQKVDLGIVGKIQHELYQILLQEIETYSNLPK
ncbi:unnamed protein product [Orchesella dallaii]|uniref:MACPF domain-containing protein n=1 Tax=Orchesella dallaii TaxID=48710 RepID=A0ABP1PHD6_9HEXA